MYTICSLKKKIYIPVDSFWYNLNAMHGRPGSPKVLTVQIVYTHLLQSVHFKYYRSPSRMLGAGAGGVWFLSVYPPWVYAEFCWIALSCCITLLCKSMQNSLLPRHATMKVFCACQRLWKDFVKRTLFVTYTCKISSEWKVAMVNKMCKKNTKDSMNWRDQNPNKNTICVDLLIKDVHYGGYIPLFLFTRLFSLFDECH